MKLAGTSSLLAALALFNQSAADFKAMRKGYNAMVAQLKKTNRSLLSTSFANVNGYGCWCFFDDKVGNGHGQPLDPIDAECQNLHKGYECAIADYGETCVPWSVTYFPVTGTPFIQQHGSISAACIHTNTVLTQFGICAATACIIESHFISEYTTITQTYNPNFAAFSHNIFAPGTNPPNTQVIGQSNFDHYAKCKTYRKYEKDKSPRKCCGTYPFRYPFKAFSYQPTKRQECCDGTIFKFADACCIGNNVVSRSTGQCP
jgi:hypothetical protein